jgi:hypothetical protein
VCFIAPIYWRSNYSGCSGFPVVPAFRSFLLYRRSSIPVVLAYRSFQLFSGCCSHGKQYKFYKGKRTKLFVMYYLLSRKSPINFVVLSGNGNKLCNGKQQVQNKNNPPSSRSQTNTQPLPSSLPTLFFVTIYLLLYPTSNRLCRACLHSFFIDRQSTRELRITRIPRDAVI